MNTTEHYDNSIEHCTDVITGNGVDTIGHFSGIIRHYGGQRGESEEAASASCSHRGCSTLSSIISAGASMRWTGTGQLCALQININ